VSDTGQIRVEGARELRRTLKRAGDDLADLKEANARAAQIVAQWASVTAPRRTGALGQSVRPNRAAGRARITGGSAAVPYAGPIHWGWPRRNITAQPFISEAAVATQPAWLPAYRDDVQRVVDRVKGA
jgi:hypothetical protein